jgi:rhodanese-related sulfurtransferase
MKRLKLVFAAVVAASLVAGLTSCAPVKLDVSDVSAIVDLRTAEEFEKSHIVGAINIDFAAGGFAAEASSLRRNGKYYMYGKDEAQVSSAMDELNMMGFVNVTNIGSFEDAVRLLPLGVTP